MNSNTDSPKRYTNRKPSRLSLSHNKRIHQQPVSSTITQDPLPTFDLLTLLLTQMSQRVIEIDSSGSDYAPTEAEVSQSTTCNNVIDLASEASDADTQPDPPGFVAEDFLLAGETPQDNLQPSCY